MNFNDRITVEFADSIIFPFHKIALFNGKKVFVDKIPSKNYIEQNVQITFEDGSTQITNIANLVFPLLGLKDEK